MTITQLSPYQRKLVEKAKSHGYNALHDAADKVVKAWQGNDMPLCYKRIAELAGVLVRCHSCGKPLSRDSGTRRNQQHTCED
jgi:hypothetical protein